MTKRRRIFVGSEMADDLVIEILARLPTKSLRRFQCVSKAWRGFISEDVLAHRRILLPMAGLFYYDDNLQRGHYAPISDPQQQEKDYCTSLESRLSTMLPFYSSTAVIHSCNGLLLFGTTNYFSDGPKVYFVCNPTTMEFVSIPDRQRKEHSPLCFLAFDPHDSPHYKVVRFSVAPRVVAPRVIVDIYSSMSGNWVELSFPCEGPVNPLVNMLDWETNSVFHKGALHMLHPLGHLVRFDVDNGDFQVLPLPEKRELDEAPACIGESRGNLYYAISMYTPPELEIWMFDEGSANKWLLKQRVSTLVFDKHPPAHAPADNEPVHSVQPIAFHPDSDVIYISVVNKFLAYHPSSGMLEEFYQVADDQTVSWMVVFTVIPYLGSINPPGGIYIQP